MVDLGQAEWNLPPGQHAKKDKFVLSRTDPFLLGNACLSVPKRHKSPSLFGSSLSAAAILWLASFDAMNSLHF